MKQLEEIQQRFEKIGEFYAAGFFEEPDSSLFVRYSRGLRRYWERRNMPSYHGELLYPCGSVHTELCVRYDYSQTIVVDWKKLIMKDAEAAQDLRKEVRDWNTICIVPREHVVGGNLYTHSFPNFVRIVKEGLNSYYKRIEKIKDIDIRRGLIDVIEGIKSFHERTLQLLKDEEGAELLYKALKKVPFEPADTLYEALVCWNFIYYMDGCDNIGHIDADLIDYYCGEDVTDVLRCFFKNVDTNNGWSGALGPNYNELTIQCLKAIKGMRRPSMELRVTPDMPQDVWDAAIEAIYAGGGSPSFYNEAAYQEAIGSLFPEIPGEDRMRFCGGGCTETMLTGISNVGSLDAGINVALIFEQVMRDKLADALDFESFYDAFIHEYHHEVIKVLCTVSESQKLRALFRPQPMRTLLIDDCIEKEKDFNNGGARYVWSIVNLAGMINVLDSLLVIRQLVFVDKMMDGKTLLKMLDEGETFLTYSGIPRHGTDSVEANTMAKRLSTDICSAFKGEVPYSGGKFLPSSIQHSTYASAGSLVGATPDGRCAGAPLCDSIGAIHGNDKYGVTALLNSASALCQKAMAGTPVLNIKLDANQTSKSLKALINGYFKSGGMQVQVTCVRKEDLLEAQKHPEEYPNLIIRIGGYSEYFSRLSPELQQTVIDRTVYGI